MSRQQARALDEGTWHKALTANRWETRLGSNWSLVIARAPDGIWRVINAPSDGSFSTKLSCEDDLEAAQLAALELVARRARFRIESDQAIIAATGPLVRAILDGRKTEQTRVDAGGI